MKNTNFPLALYERFLPVLYFGLLVVALSVAVYAPLRAETAYEPPELQTAQKSAITQASEAPGGWDVYFTGPNVEEIIRSLAHEHNFPWPDYLVRLAVCESGLNPLIVGDDGLSRGLFQIHSGYHPNVSDECAFNVPCATEWAMKQILAGHQGWWVCDALI